MDQQDYVSVLKRVPRPGKQHDTTLRLTPEDIALLCPHLSRKEIAKLWQEKRRFEGNQLLVALPPIRMPRPALYLGFRPHSTYEYDMHVGPIHWKPESVPYFEEALRFAQQSWPHALITEEVKGVCDFSLKRADDLEHGRTTNVLFVSGAMRMTREEVTAQAAYTPSHEVLERAIISLTTDELVRSENFGGLRTSTETGCVPTVASASGTPVAPTVVACSKSTTGASGATPRFPSRYCSSLLSEGMCSIWTQGSGGSVTSHLLGQVAIKFSAQIQSW